MSEAQLVSLLGVEVEVARTALERCTYHLDAAVRWLLDGDACLLVQHVASGPQHFGTSSGSNPSRPPLSSACIGEDSVVPREQAPLAKRRRHVDNHYERADVYVGSIARSSGSKQWLPPDHYLHGPCWDRVLPMLRGLEVTILSVTCKGICLPTQAALTSAKIAALRRKLPRLTEVQIDLARKVLAPELIGISSYEGDELMFDFASLHRAQQRDLLRAIFSPDAETLVASLRPLLAPQGRVRSLAPESTSPIVLTHGSHISEANMLLLRRSVSTQVRCFKMDGFADDTLNTIYILSDRVLVKGFKTYLQRDLRNGVGDPKALALMYWQAGNSRWAICPWYDAKRGEDAIDLVRSGSELGVAYHRPDDMTSWHEWWEGEWQFRNIRVSAVDFWATVDAR